MRARSRSFDPINVLPLLVLAAAVFAAGVAEARTELLRWTQAQVAEVVTWEAHVGTSSGSYTDVIPLPNPTLGGDGALQSTIEVDDDATVFIVLRAIAGDGRRSSFSNERQRSPASAPPAPPPAPAPGPGGTVGPGTTIPAAPGAVHREDFTGMPTSPIVTDWHDTAPNFSLSENDGLFMVRSLGGNALLATGETEPDMHSHYVGSGAGWSNMTLTGRLATDDAGAGIGVTIASAYPNTDRYYRLGRAPGGAFEISSRPGSLSCPASSTGVVPTPGSWYVFRLSVVSEAGGQRIQARVWEQGQQEPASPQAECLDSGASGANSGTFGVWSAGAGQKFWDDFEVTLGTGGGGGSGPIAPPILIQIVPTDS